MAKISLRNGQLEIARSSKTSRFIKYALVICACTLLFGIINNARGGAPWSHFWPSSPAAKTRVMLQVVSSGTDKESLPITSAELTVESIEQSDSNIYVRVNTPDGIIAAIPDEPNKVHITIPHMPFQPTMEVDLAKLSINEKRLIRIKLRPTYDSKHFSLDASSDRCGPQCDYFIVRGGIAGPSFALPNGPGVPESCHVCHTQTTNYRFRAPIVFKNN